MAPRTILKDAEGNIIEEFGDKDKGYFGVLPNRPGSAELIELDYRYSVVVRKNGEIDVYRRPKGLLGFTQEKIGTYEDNTFTPTDLLDSNSKAYFADPLARRDVKSKAKLAVEESLKSYKNTDGSDLFGPLARENLVANIVDGTALSDEDLSQLQTEDSRDTLAGTVEIGEIPTINIEGKGRTEYGNYYYPLALATDDTGQDRIKFSMRVPSGTQVDSALFASQKVFQRKLSDIIGSVTLPIQPVISDRNTVDFAGLTLNAVDAALAGTAYSLADSANVEQLFERGGAALRGVQQTLLNADTGVQEGLKVFLAQQAAGVQGLLSRTTGAVLNPNLELLFRGPQLRPFSFSFTLSPRNREEAIQTRNIIRFFKQGMSVKTTASNVFLKSPNVFDINYQTFDGEGKQITHPSINLIKTCALVDCGVEYTPDGSYMTFNDPERTMTSYKINLQFSELDPVYDTDYDAHPEENFIGF